MGSLNKVLLIGNLGRAPVMRRTGSGNSVANFSIATTENYTDNSGQKQERTEWHNVVAFSNLATICEKFLDKGRQVFVEGRLQTRKWKDKNGQDRYTTEVIATNIVLLGRREGGAQTVAAAAGPVATFEDPVYPETTSSEDEEPPF